jgi:hypothetical protein
MIAYPGEDVNPYGFIDYLASGTVMRRGKPVGPIRR